MFSGGGCEPSTLDSNKLRGAHNKKDKTEMQVGIEAIEMYIPNSFVDQTDLGTSLPIPEKHNNVSEGKYTKGLGQLQLSFAYPFEDVNSMALTGKNASIQPSAISCGNTTSLPPRSVGSKWGLRPSLTSPNPPRPS